MFVSIDWIKDYVDLSGVNTDELINKFTLGTAEIEGYEESNKFLEEIRVVEIVNIEKHPEADKLNLVKFKLSETETFQVVCGAGERESWFESTLCKDRRYFTRRLAWNLKK